ncbi:MAG: hypothetical protein U1E73_06465 [Planctomycetota bacterium]
MPYQVVQRHLLTFRARLAGAADGDTGHGAPPAIVGRELRAFLDCGVLARGFCRLHRDACGKDEQVAFSGKRRGSPGPNLSGLLWRPCQPRTRRRAAHVLPIRAASHTANSSVHASVAQPKGPCRTPWREFPSPHSRASAEPYSWRRRPCGSAAAPALDLMLASIRSLFSLGGAVAVGIGASAQAPVSIQFLGNVIGVGATVSGLSDDGSTLIGHYSPGPGLGHGYRLRGSTVQDLGVLPNHNTSSAAAVNGNGDVVVGSSSFTSFCCPLPPEATRAQTNSQFGGLGLLPTGTYSGATGVDASGDVILGIADYTPQPFTQLQVPVMWLLGVIQTLPTGSSSDSMWPVAVDDVGTKICGIAQDGSGTRHAIQWSGAASGPVYLTPLPTHTGSDTIAISSAGDIVVGHSWNQYELKNVRWRNGVAEDLGRPLYYNPGAQWYALCANADCTLIGGEGRTNGFPSRAMLWKEGRGWIDLDDLLWRLGVNLGGNSLMSIQAISADGSVIAGTTTNSEAFLLHNLPLDGFHVRDIGCGIGADIYHYGLPVRGQTFGINTSGGNQSVILAGAPVSLPVPGCSSCRAGAIDFSFFGNSLQVNVPNASWVIGITLAFQGAGTIGWGPYPCLNALKFTSAVDVTLR